VYYYDFDNRPVLYDIAKRRRWHLDLNIFLVQ
jgi:hypothetical protein